MKIVAVRTIPLGGATHDHGWPGGTDPNVQYNTLVEVVSEDGLIGIGSCYTTRALVEGSLGGSADENRGLEVRLTGAEVDDLTALCFERAGSLRDRNRRRLLELRHVAGHQVCRRHVARKAK